MTLTIIDQPTFITNKAAGQYTEVSVLVQSDISLFGATIYVNPALWLNTQSVAPDFGFFRSFPIVPGVYNLDWVSNNDSQRNINGTIETIDVRNFRITLRYIHFADLDNYVTNSNINHLDRITLQGLGGSSVYAQQKKLIISIKADIFNVGSDTVYTDINYSAAHFNRSLNNGSPLTNWSYVLTQNNVPSQNFSQLQNTKINFVIPSQTPIQNKYYFGIFKATNVQSGGNYWDATSMQYAEIQSGTKNTLPIPHNNSFITAQSGLTMVGSTGLASVTIDKDYFENSECYRFFLCVQIGNAWQSWLSPEICLLEQYDPTYGNITINSNVQGSDTMYGNCLYNVPKGTTLEVCFEHDKISYNAALLANNLGVSYDANFKGVQMRLNFSAPIPNQLPSGLGFVLSPPVITETATTQTVCKTFTTPGSDTGIFYISCVWEFEVSGPYGTYTDYIVSYFKFQNVNNSFSNDITLGDIIVNDEVYTDPVICKGLDDEIIVNIDIAGGLCEGAEYDVKLHEKGDITSIYNNCINSITETLTGLAIAIDTNCVGDAELCLTITIFGCSESISEPVCDECLEYTLEFNVLALNEDSQTLQVVWDLTNFDPWDSVRGIIITSAPARQQIEFDVNTPTGQFTWGEDGSGDPRFVDPQVLFLIERNGCQYYICWSMNYIVYELGTFATITSEICPDVNLCEDFVLNPSECEEEAGNLLLECTEPGTVTITAETGWDIEYNLDGGNTWLPYSAPITIDPETNLTCSVYARAILPATELCPEQIEYAIIDDCCPIPDCPELACEPIAQYDEEAETFTLGYDCGSEETPDVVTIEYSIDGGVTYLTYSAPIDVTAIDNIIWRIIISYEISYPLCDPNSFTFEDEWFKDGVDPNTCESNPGLEVDYINGCHTATPIGDVFYVDTDVISYSIDNGLTFIEWDLQPICGVDLVIWKREVCYTNDCPCDCVVQITRKDSEINCDCIDWTITINKSEGTLCPVVFGINDYNVEWHIGGNNGFVPLGGGGGFNATNFTVLGGVNTLDIGLLSNFNNTVYVNGILQVSPTNYTITGSIITFIDPPLEDYTVTIISYQNEAGCVPITSNGLYRLTVIDENGCKRYAYRLEYVCDECPICDLIITKINEDGLGTYEAGINCEGEVFTGEWQQYDTDTNQFVFYSNSNPITPSVEGLYRFVGILDNNPECPIEASVLVCGSTSEPLCPLPNYAYRVIMGQGDWEVSEIEFEGFTLDSATPGMNFPYQIYPGGYGVSQLDKDLQALLFNDDVYQCCEGIDTPIKVELSYENITNNYTLNIECINEQYWTGGWKPVSITTSDGPYTFTETVDDANCCDTECTNYQFTAVVPTVSELLEEISLFGNINLSLEAGFNFPYDLSDSADRTQLQTDLETWISVNNYTSCCPDPTMQLNSGVDIEYGYEPSLGTNLCRISIICWSGNNADWITYDTTNTSGNWMRIRLSNDFCCGFA